MTELLRFTLALIASLVPNAPGQSVLAAAITIAAEERPIVRGDAYASAALLVSVAFHETGRSFDCSRVGDNGHSVSCFQIWATSAEQRERLRGDVFEAARVARDMLAASMHACRRLETAERISQYTCGKCVRNKESRVRWHTSESLLNKFALLKTSSASGLGD